MGDESEGNRRPYMRLWISDARSSCMVMSAAQFGAHMRMLMWGWEHGYVPADEGKLRMIVGPIDWADMDEVLERWRKVILPNGKHGYVNARQERERERMEHEADKRRKSGRKGAGSRWDGKDHGKQDGKPDGKDHGKQDGKDHGKQDGNDHGKSMAIPYSHTPILPDSETPTFPNSHTPTLPKVEVGPKARRRATATITWDFESGFAGIPESDLTEWADAYGKIDVPEQVKQAHQHLRVHTEKRYKNYRRYLGDWMARAQRYAEERIAKAEAAEAARARGPVRDESHIPEDVHPDDRRTFWTPDGKPKMPAVWRRKDGTWNID